MSEQLDVRENLARNLKRLCEKNNMNLKDVANVTGIKLLFLKKIMDIRAKRILLHHLEELCKCFKTDMKDLLN